MKGCKNTQGSAILHGSSAGTCTNHNGGIHDPQSDRPLDRQIRVHNTSATLGFRIITARARRSHCGGPHEMRKTNRRVPCKLFQLCVRCCIRTGSERCYDVVRPRACREKGASGVVAFEKDLNI